MGTTATTPTNPTGSVLQQIANTAIPALVSEIPALANDLVSLIASIATKHSTAANTTKSPGTGPVVFADVLLKVQNDLIKAIQAGQVTSPVPSPAVLNIIIQSVYTALNIVTSGTMPSATVASTSSSQTYTVKAGQTITITGV